MVARVPCLHPSGGQACLSRVDHDAGSTVGANSRNFMTGARGYGSNMGMVASLRDANHGTLSRTMAPSPSRLITRVPRCQGVRVSGVPCLHPSGGKHVLIPELTTMPVRLSVPTPRVQGGCKGRWWQRGHGRLASRCEPWHPLPLG